jgi:hypothetical protein
LKLPASKLFGSVFINLLTFNVIMKVISIWWCTLQKWHLMNAELSFNWQYMVICSHFSMQHLGKFKYNYFGSKGSSLNTTALTGRPRPSKQNDNAYASIKMQPKLNPTKKAIDCREQ